MNSGKSVIRSSENFRDVLRKETSASHMVAEEIFGPFTASPEEHLFWFLKAQQSGLTALKSTVLKSTAVRKAATGQPSLISKELLEDLLRRLSEDVGLVNPSTQQPPAVPFALDPVAVDYIVLGSRLGTETIRRHQLHHMKEAEVPSYFKAFDKTKPLWADLIAILKDIPPGSERATRIVRHTTLGFDVFRRAALSVPLSKDTL